MGFFSKRKNENNGFIINTDDEPVKISGNKNLAPHAMTADEISDLWVLGDKEQDYNQPSALDSLKKRMNVSQSEAPQSENHISPDTETAQIKNDVTQPHDSKHTAKHSDNSKDSRTLVEKVKRYTVDEDGHDVSENHKPIYELQSVAEILMNEGTNAIKDLSKKYGVDFVVDDLGKNEQKEEPVQEKAEKEKQLAETRKERAREIEEQYKKIMDDRKEYQRMINDFVQDYGGFHCTFKSNEPIFSDMDFFDLLKYAFTW